MSQVYKLSTVSVVCVIGLCTTLATSTITASAQSPTSGKTDAAPRQVQNAANRFVTTNWNVGCQPNAATKQLVCQLSRAVLIAKSRQLIMKISIGEKPHRIVMQLLHELDLKAGVKLQIDKNPAQILTFSTSNQQGVYTDTLLSSRLLTTMQKGKKITITVSARNGKKIIIPLSLDGFAIAFEKIK